MNLILINLAGLVLMAFIVWWFWLAHPQSRLVTGAEPVEILVEGGAYQPARVEAQAGRPLRLRFIRKDPSPCAEKVLFEKLGITRDLSVGKAEEIHLLVKQPGVYEFTCQMGMYRGSLVIKTATT